MVLLSHRPNFTRRFRLFGVLFASVLLLSANLDITAQTAPQTPDLPDYQLRQPTLEEYLNTVLEISELPVMDSSESSRDPFFSILSMIPKEIEQRYNEADFENVPLELLFDATPHVVGPLFTFNVYLQSEVTWHQYVLSAWLHQVQPDLSSQSQWQFGDYTLEVQPVDFDVDGKEDYAAELLNDLNIERNYAPFKGYFVIQVPQQNEYQVISNTLPAFSIMCYPYTACDGDGKSRDILDITGDGRPEWLIQSAQCGYGICSVALSVFQWQTDEMVDISGEAQQGPFMSLPAGSSMPVDPPHGGWNIENLDDDAALEVIQYETLKDNLGCSFELQRIFNWNNSNRQFSEERSANYEDSLWCDLRQGHEAITSLDPDAAVQHYERFLKHNPETGLEDVWTYVSLRLALAYGLSGQADQATAALQTLKDQPIANPLIETLFNAAQAAASDATDKTIGVKLCEALYSSLRESNLLTGDDFRLLFQYGHLNDYGMSMNYDMSFGVTSFGCNLPLLLQRTLPDLDPVQPFNTQLEANGWKISHHTQPDLNQDGINDEILYIEALRENLLRISTEAGFEYYILYGEPLVSDDPDVTTEMTGFTQPDGHQALLSVSYDETVECGSSSDPASLFTGVVSVWSLDKPVMYDQRPRLQAGICEPQTLAETLPSSDTIVIMASVEKQQVKYLWDDASSQYQIDTPVTLQSRFPTCLSGNLTFCVPLNQPEEVLAFVEFMEDYSIDPARPLFISGLSYYRALALEELGRDDEALAEYIALYEADPESPWHILAGLHLERR